MPDLAGRITEHRLHEDGVIPSARIPMAVNPTDGDTLTIGADVYEFVDPAVNTVVNNDARVAVVVGAAAANTRANLVLAINGTGTAGATITKADGVTPALEDGTVSVLAAEDSTDIVIKPAAGVGGSAVASSPSVALSDTLTSGVSWSMTNVNLGGGRVRSSKRGCRTEFTVTTAMIAGGKHVLSVGFTAAGYLWLVRGATGTTRSGGTDTLAHAAGVFTLTLHGGGGDIVNGNVVSLYAWEG